MKREFKIPPFVDTVCGNAIAVVTSELGGEDGHDLRALYESGQGDAFYAELKRFNRHFRSVEDDYIGSLRSRMVMASEVLRGAMDTLLSIQHHDVHSASRWGKEAEYLFLKWSDLWRRTR